MVKHSRLKTNFYLTRIKCLHCQRKHNVKLKNSWLVICDCKTQLAINGDLTASAELLKEEIKENGIEQGIDALNPMQ